MKEILTWLKGVRDSGYVLAIWSCGIRGAPEYGFVCSSAFLYSIFVVHKQALFGMPVVGNCYQGCNYKLSNCKVFGSPSDCN